MKILHLIDEPWDSGLVAYALHIAELLQKAGQEVAIGVLPGKKPEAMARERGLKTYPLNGFWDLRRILKSASWDIVNPHTGRAHSWAVIARMLHLYTGPSFAIVRTRGDARRLLTHPLFQFLYRQTDGVIAASEHVRKQYEEGLAIDEIKARTIYPGIEVDAERHPGPSGVVGIVGRLDMVKGHSVFLEAAARVLQSQPQVRFRVAGKEAGVSLQILQNQVQQLGIGAQVEFLGYVPSATDFMRECALGVIASLGSEEVSRSCLEWMGVGRPVVGTLVGCLPELIEPEETGLLVPPGDSVALAEAILRFVRNPAMRETWGQRAREVARVKYSPEIFIHKTLDLYEWAADNHRRGHGRTSASNRAS